MKLSIVVPVFNSASLLPRLAHEIHVTMLRLGIEYELILVNDASKDASWETICEAAAENAQISGINLTRNYGQHNALLCGIRAARYEVIVTLDDDLQNPPSEIPKLLAKLQEGYDFVYGSPGKQHHGLYRVVGSTAIKQALSRVMKAEAAECMTSFRAFRTELRNAFNTYQNSDVVIDVLLNWGTERIASVSVEHTARPQGKSNYTFGQLVNLAWSIVTGFSALPLHLATWIGVACLLSGTAGFSFALIRFFVHGGTVPGFLLLACLIMTMSGAQMISLGIIGEYLARMHGRSANKPPYVVKGRTPASNSLSNLSPGSPGTSKHPAVIVDSELQNTF